MENITLDFKLEMLIPTIEVYREYFNENYPCDEDNEIEMTIEDEAKYATYNYLLSIYEKFKDVANESYAGFIDKIRTLNEETD